MMGAFPLEFFKPLLSFIKGFTLHLKERSDIILEFSCLFERKILAQECFR